MNDVKKLVIEKLSQDWKRGFDQHTFITVAPSFVIV